MARYQRSHICYELAASAYYLSNTSSDHIYAVRRSPSGRVLKLDVPMLLHSSAVPRQQPSLLLRHSSVSMTEKIAEVSLAIGDKY